MKLRFILVALFSLLASQAAAQAGENAGTHTIDGSYYVDQLEWNRGQSNTIYLNILEQSGRYVVCAATQRVTQSHHRSRCHVPS